MRTHMHCDNRGFCCMHCCTKLHFCLVLWCNLTDSHVLCLVDLGRGVMQLFCRYVSVLTVTAAGHLN